jgi:hypothetical protein
MIFSAYYLDMRMYLGFPPPKISIFCVFFSSRPKQAYEIKHPLQHPPPSLISTSQLTVIITLDFLSHHNNIKER